MPQNSTMWPEMAQSGPKLLNLAQNDSIWPKKYSSVAQNDSTFFVNFFNVAQL